MTGHYTYEYFVYCCCCNGQQVNIYNHNKSYFVNDYQHSGNNQLPRVDLFKDLEIIFFKLIFVYEIPDKPSVQTVNFTRGPGIKYRYQSANLA